MELMSKVDSEGLAYVASTAQAIAYERALESKREDRLFNDHLAHHFVGERGETISGFINKMLGAHMNFEGIHLAFTPARTKLINDYLEKWINETEASG